MQQLEFSGSLDKDLAGESHVLQNNLEEPLLLVDRSSGRTLSWQARLLYGVTQGFRPFESLLLALYRRSQYRLTLVPGADVVAQDGKKLRQVHTIQSASDGFHNSLEYLFNPLYLSFLIRDAVYYSHLENQLGFSVSNLLLPTRMSDTFYTSSLMQYYPANLQWRACLMLFPFAVSFVRAVMSYSRFHYFSGDFQTDGQATRFSDLLFRAARHPWNPLIRFSLITLMDSAIQGFLYHQSISEGERKECFQKIKTFAELPNERCLNYYGQTALYHIIHVLQSSSNAQENQAVIVEAQEILKRCQMNGGMMSLSAGYFNWLLNENPSLLANAHAIHVGARFYLRAMYWTIWLGGLVQLIQHWVAQFNCTQEWSYVFALAEYACSICPDWQHEVNAAEINNPALCVQHYLDHPHTPQELQMALYRGAKYSQSNDRWSLDLSQTKWESLSVSDWQLLQAGFKLLNEKIYLANLSLPRIGDVKAIALVAKLSELTYYAKERLDLSDQVLTVEVVDRLRFAPSLQQLNLANTHLNDAIITLLTVRLNETRLTHLDLTGTLLYDQGAEALVSSFSQWPLQQLSLAGGEFSPTSLLTLLTGLTQTPLRTLDLSGVEITTSMLDPLIQLINQGLTDLSLAQCTINPFDLIELAQAISAGGFLTTLNLADNSVDENVLLALFAQGTNSTLTTLSLNGCELTEDCLVALCQGIKANTLRHLFLRKTQLTASLLNELSFECDEITVETLDLSQNRLQTADWFSFVNSTQRTNATTPLNLILQDCDLVDQDFENLVTGFNNSTRVLTLDLSSNQLTDASARSVADLAAATLLHALYLNHNAIGDEVVYVLAQILSSQPIKELGLAATQISVVGVRALTQALPHSVLESLNVTDTTLNDEAAFLLAAALYQNEMPHAEEFIASSPTQDWRHYFSTAMPGQTPFQLEIANTLISDSGGQALCLAQTGFLNHAGVLRLGLFGNSFDRVDPVHCGLTSGTASLSVNFALALVLLHFLYQGWSWFSSVWNSLRRSESEPTVHTLQVNTLFQPATQRSESNTENTFELKR